MTSVDKVVQWDRYLENTMVYVEEPKINEGKQDSQGQTSVESAPTTTDEQSSPSSSLNKTKRAILHPKAMFFLILWYLFSACTLFLNKYILTTFQSDPTLLGAAQMLTTTVLGSIQMHVIQMDIPVVREGKPPHFWRNMILLGAMRFTTIMLSLVALKFVAASFTETVKSSAPLFTVFISNVMLGEYTGCLTFMSLGPIMCGLALSSAYELSFNIQGFVAALGTNLTDCIQNVYSKKLISGEKFKYTPAELQFYTSLASIAIQIPAYCFMMDLEKIHKTLDYNLLSLLILNGTSFHFQSITAYGLMDYISPVTHSVANTVKRAFLIWTSVLLFGNPVTLLSGLGTATVICGVCMYTKAKEYDARFFAKYGEMEIPMYLSSKKGSN